MSHVRLFKTAAFAASATPQPDGFNDTLATIGSPPMGYKWTGTVQVIGQYGQSGIPDVSPGDEDWHVFLAGEPWGVFFSTQVFGPIVLGYNDTLTVRSENLTEDASYYTLVFIGDQTEDDGSEPYGYPVALTSEVTVTSSGNPLPVAVAGPIPVFDVGGIGGGGSLNETVGSALINVNTGNTTLVPAPAAGIVRKITSVTAVGASAALLVAIRINGKVCAYGQLSTTTGMEHPGPFYLTTHLMDISTSTGTCIAAAAWTDSIA